MATDTGTPKKMRKLDGSEGDDSAEFGGQDFDAETQKTLEEIDHCQNEIDSLNEQASEEILKVEQKYNKLRKPHFEQRNEYIKEIPKFWYTAFMNHPQISAILEEEEEVLLQYLYQVEVEEFEDIKSGYRIKFYFRGNPYFENDVLCKEFQLGTTGDPASQSSPIDWKKDMDLTKKPDSVPGQKRKSASRSFVSWYLDNSDPSADDIAEVIKDDMWPNPIQYFQNHGIEIGENGMDSDEDDDDLDESVVVVGDDDDEDEEDEDEEEEEDVVVEGEEDDDEEDEGDEDKDAA